jgi:tRNA (guanine-N7-)-methyltransferase
VSRRLKYDIPGPDWRITIEDVRAKGWAELLAPDVPDPLPRVLEIGFGRGEFLIDLARHAPDVAHVGVEVSWKRVLKMARRLARTEIRNVRLVHATGEEAVAHAIAPATLQEAWINFPDPWPKERHHRRRLVQAPLVAALADRLAPGGTLHVATDDAGYAEQIDAVLAAETRLENAFAPDRWREEVPGRTPTAYELEWRAEGRRLHFWAYRRLPTGGTGWSPAASTTPLPAPSRTGPR